MIGGTFAATYPDRIGSAVLMNCTTSRGGIRRIPPTLTRSVLKGGRRWFGGVCGEKRRACPSGPAFAVRVWRIHRWSTSSSKSSSSASSVQ
jgi:hypothetical protein